MKKYRNRKISAGKKLLLGLFLGCLFLLAGCTAKVDTELQISPDFAGQRVMTCYFKKSDIGKLSSGVENMVGKYCPPELTYTAGSNQTYIIYTFTLSFSSQEEYTKKVESLLNYGLAEGEQRRAPSILYTQPDTVLMTGFRYSEDFTSADLLKWIDQAIVTEGGSEEEFSWEIGPTSLNYDGKTTQVPSQIALDSISSYPVDTVEISTEQKEDGVFDRRISISFPESTMQALGDSLTEYLQGLVPENGTGSWGEGDNARIFTYTISNALPDDMKNATQRILNGETAAVTYGEDTLRETATVERHYFEEELDLSSYASGGTNQAKLVYRFHAANGYQVDSGGVYQEGVLQNAGEIQNETAYVYQGEHNLVRMRVDFSQTHLLNSVEIILRHTLNQDVFERQIILVYDSTNSKNGANYAARYFNEIRPVGGTAARETRGQYDVCRLTMKGSSASISEMLAALFGEGNGMTFQNDREALSFKNYASIRDQISMAAFLGDKNAFVPMTYTIQMGNAQQVMQLTYTDQGEAKSAETEDGADSQTFAIPMAGTVVSYQGSFINLLGVVAISAIAFIGTALVALVVISIVKMRKKRGITVEEDDLAELRKQDRGNNGNE